jgi:ribosomal protein S27AE
VEKAATVRQPELKPTATLCPRCGAAMLPFERSAAGREQHRLRVGMPVPPTKKISVWHCGTCHIDWPRFE